MMYVLLEEAPEAGVTVVATELNEVCEVRPAGLGGATCWAGPPKRELATGVDGYAIAGIGVGGQDRSRVSGVGARIRWDLEDRFTAGFGLDAFTSAPS